MTNKELFYFTGKCLTLDDHPEFSQEIIQKIESDSIDWEKFITLCSNHLMIPAMYLKFKAFGITGHLPDELAKFLKEVYDLNLSRNNQILKQLDEVTKVLNENGIYPIFMKGTGNLLDRLYSDTGERMIGDIDLLVPEKDYLRTVKVLENDGYSADFPNYLDVEKLKHYPGLLKEGAATHIEVHRIPVAEDYSRWFNTEIIDKEKTLVSLDGCFVLSDNHKIVLNFIHSQLGHDGHVNGIVSFRDIYDLYLLSKRSDIKQTIPTIKSKQKAIAYYVFAGKALGLNKSLYPTPNFSYRLFSTKHDLNLSSATFYHAYRSTVYFAWRIFVRYIGQFIKSFYSKDTRQSVITRLSNPKWYKAHLASYTSFFTRKK
jgi:hypothetical protein